MLGKLSVTVMLLDYTVNADVDIFNIFCLFASVVFILIFFFFFLMILIIGLFCHQNVVTPYKI